MMIDGRRLRHRIAKSRIVGGAIAIAGSRDLKDVKSRHLPLQHQSAYLLFPSVVLPISAPNVLVNGCREQHC